MKIGIVGAGFTGLSAAYYLLKQGHDVTVFEKDPNPGGLAIGFKPAHHSNQGVAGGQKDWDWSLEKHYHHWFTNDKFILGLAKEIEHKVIVKRPKTSVYVDKKIYQFDSPVKVLLFPKLSIIDRLRMGFIVGFLRYNPFWKPLEKINATTFLPRAMGQRGYKMIWEPLFKSKFGPFANDISLAWFWARIVKRTPSLAYPEGGFLNFAKHLTNVIEKKGGKINFNVEVIEVTDNNKVKIRVKENKGEAKEYVFDKVIFTLPSFIFFKTAPQLPESYKEKFAKLRGLGATNLVLRLRKPFFYEGTYWLNICDPTSPVMAIVEHTNFMDKKYYKNEHLLYLGNYLPPDSKRFAMEKDELLKLFDPYLRKISPDYQKNLINYELFKVPFAQPIIPTNYSKMIPHFETPLNNVYLANIQQVYPWDRGTNYAVELGKKVADLISE